MKPYDSIRDKKSQIRAMFDNIAPTYDRLNHIMSMNIDRLWRRRAVTAAVRHGGSDILDVATGTGDLAIELARRMPEARICGVDLSAEMLKVAEAKFAARGMAERISLSQGEAEHLEFADGTFDAVTVAFGVRNFEDIEGGLREMRRVLKSGGMLVVLELSTPSGGLFGAAYRLYSHIVLPKVGGLVSNDGKAYEYLPASVDEFPSPERFTDMMRAAGFDRCRARSQSFGTATIYTGLKI
ncbi:MAG: bifunctional demethylmenaquinone methyltransferase/2-methoxy-6-polyprenyl-1,4-benzoquinol methylase UbiE [Alistipes sp.]|nr:bifunctional demethylmenaquinone methyltransferase/2-methoxy-6-polyprenyl-1,4-benzoquinol methylase UbiE [Alistipes sp.]